MAGCELPLCFGYASSFGIALEVPYIVYAPVAALLLLERPRSDIEAITIVIRLCDIRFRRCALFDNPRDA